MTDPLACFRVAMWVFAESKVQLAPWSTRYPDRTSGGSRRLVAEVVGALTVFAGGDLPALMRSMIPLNTEGGNLLETIAPEPYSTLRRMAVPFNSLSPTEKHPWVVAMHGGGATGGHFVRDDVVALGWEVGRKLWENDGSLPVGKRGRPAIDPNVLSKVSGALEHASVQSTSKKLKSGGGDVAVQRMQVPFIQVYQECPAHDQLCRSSFYKYIGHQYKQRGLVRDTCDYCQDSVIANHSIAHRKADHQDVAHFC